MRIMAVNDLQNQFLARLTNPLPLMEVFDLIPDLYFYIKDVEGRIVKANRALVTMRGFENEAQIIGKTDFDLHPRYLAELYVCEDREVIARKAAIPNQVWLIPDHGRKLRWFVSSKTPLFGDAGEVIGIAGTLYDFEQPDVPDQPYQEMEQVLSYILHNYREKIDVGELAAMMHLSISQFDRRFKRLFQMTPQEYILRVRINTACQALIDGQSTIGQVAQQAGFYDQSYFTKQFRRRIGITPLAYRRKHSNRRVSF
jgi:AraC-like DNA-binding protein